MSSANKKVLQYAVETTSGVTPTPFDRKTIPYSGDTLNAEVNRSEDNTIIDSRLPTSQAITSVSYGGDISASLRYGIYDDFIAGAAMNDWVLGVDDGDPDVLTFAGDLRKSFSIMIDYTDLAALGKVQLFKGMQVGSWSLSIPSEGIIENTFTFMGRERTPLTTPPAGTVTPAPKINAISSVGVGEILIDGDSTLDVACIESFDFTWSNELVQVPCLGSGLKGGKIKETSASGTGSFVMQWSDEAIGLFESQFEGDATISIVIPITDTLGNSYKLTLPSVQVTAPLGEGSAGEMLTSTFNYTVIDEAPTLERLPVAP